MWTLSGFADEISPDLEEQCRTLDELGITFIEFRSAWNTNVLDLTDAQLDDVERILWAHNIRFSSVGSPIGKIGINDDFDAHFKRFERAIDVAHRFDAPYIRIFSFYPPPAADPAEYRDDVLQRMRALADGAEKASVTLLHENEKGIYGDVPDRCRDIVESVASDRLKIAWDAANFVQCGVRPFTDGLAMLRPHLEYVQIKDAVFADGSVRPAGEGDGEVRETVRALRDDGFDGFFSMEPHLAHAGAAGGFSGADLFVKATQAFTGILRDENIEYQ